MKTILFRLFAFFVAIFFYAASFCLADTKYVVTELSPLIGSGRLSAINDLGQIVGYLDSGQGFLWSNGQKVLIGNSNFLPTAINNLGIIAGDYQVGDYTHAALYNGSSIIDLGIIAGTNNSHVTDINDFGQVIGYSFSDPASPEYAFLYDSNGIRSLPSFEQAGNAYAFGINNNGVIVGESMGAVVWKNGSVSRIPTTNNAYHSSAKSINDKGQIVGFQQYPNATKAFVYNQGQITELVSPPRTDSYYTEISEAHAINNHGQIVGSYMPGPTGSPTKNGMLWNTNGTGTVLLPAMDAVDINNVGQVIGNSYSSWNWGRTYLLTPVGTVQSYQVKPSVIPPIERLAKWDGTSWVSVLPGDLSSGNIHVLVHGWAPGLRTFSDNGGKIWDEKDPITGAENGQYQLLTNAAASIKHVAPGDIVVAFDWLDMSATDSSWPTEAHKSRDKTDEAAASLTGALRSASDFAGEYSGKLHLLGISHGARVATLATEKLYNKGTDGSVVVDHLTLGDSPEKSVVAINKLDGILKNINIGRSSGTTFVDNYFSLWGREYETSNDIVNVQLYPYYPDWDFGNNHVYPLNWYTGANFFANDVALDWSPLVGDTYKTLGSDYEQNWKNSDGTFDWSREYILKQTDIVSLAPVEQQSKLDLATLFTQGLVTGIPNGKLLTENSPAFWHTGFAKNPNDTTIEFSYQFLNAGDGDQLGLWIDDELRFIITGQLIGTEMMMSDIDISDLLAGEHILSVALHNYGDANASVQVFDFTMLSVPEPSSLYLFCVAVIFAAIAMSLRRKSASI